MERYSYLSSLFPKRTAAEAHEAVRGLISTISAIPSQNEWQSGAPSLAGDLLVAFPNPQLAQLFVDTLLGIIDEANDASANDYVARWTAGNSIVMPFMFQRIAADHPGQASTQRLNYLASLFKLVHLDSAPSDELNQLYVAILQSLKDGDLNETYSHLIITMIPAAQRINDPLLWQTIQSLSSSPVRARIWLKWISSLDHDDEILGILRDNLYWELILQALYDGSSDTRKHFLAILRKTISILRHNVETENLKVEVAIDQEELQTHFAKYCTLFQTIIMDRYPNQVLQALPDLDRLMTSDFNPIWIDTLIRAALRKDIQDGIRKIVGNWFMKIAAANPKILRPNVLESFYEWTTQHSFFLSSARKRRRSVFSRHGDKLSMFYEQLLLNLGSTDDYSLTIISAVNPLLNLAKGTRNGIKISAYAWIYALNGIYRGLSGSAVTIEALNVLCSTYSLVRTPLESMKDAICVFCMNIRCNDAETLQQNNYYREIQEHYEKLMSSPMPKKIYRYDRIRDLDFDKFLGYSKSVPTLSPDTLLEIVASSFIQYVVPHLNYSAGRLQGYELACAFDLLNRSSLEQQSFCEKLLAALIEPWATQTSKHLIISKWKATTQLQMMLILSESRLPNMDTEECTQHLNTMIKILGTEPLPRYRYLIEWIILRVFCSRSETRQFIIDELLKHDETTESNPKLLTSLMRIATKVACLPDGSEEFALRLMTLLIPLSASPKIAVRYEAQWSVPVIWDRAVEGDWKTVTENPAFEHLNTFIRSLDKYSNPPAERSLEAFDPIKDHTLANLFMGKYLQIYPPEPEIVSTMDFEEVWKDDKKEGLELPPCNIPLGVAPVEQELEENGMTDIVNPPGPVLPPSDAAQIVKNIPLQTKGLQDLSSTSSISDLAASTSHKHSPNLIVVASLLDKPHNLGGLSRCSEIFGSSLLTVPSLSVLNNKEFVAVSVSSHSNIPSIMGVKPADLAAFLQSKKIGNAGEEPYTIVGVEQTDQSLVLGKEGTKLPRRMCMVLGAEKTGIPADVLMECEMCVEIGQVGITRSLNVQTAASCVLFEWQRQHGLN